MQIHTFKPIEPDEDTVVIQSEKSISLVCGKSSITLHPDGKIVLSGLSLLELTEDITLKAQYVDICPK